MTAKARTAPLGIATFFASPERANDDEIRSAAARIREDPIVQAILEAVDGDLLVLDEHRQVLAANHAFLERIGGADPAEVLGARPGELLDCTHAPEAPSGCGTGRPCATCGAALAIIASQKTHAVTTRECLMRLGRDGHEAAEFRVRCSPLTVADHQLTAVLLHDVSAEKRRDALERIFLHDLMNTVGGLMGWGSLLAESDVTADEAVGQIVRLSERLASEVRAHRALVKAESGDLEVQPATLSPASVLEAVTQTLAKSDVARERVVETTVSDAPNRTFESDPLLVGRVLANMVKNALEATEPGGRVRAGFTWRGDTITFDVHNEGVIPPRVQLQIFQRSFSTKGGRGRGLGTWSMKLLGERYLGGRVTFTSREGEGTTFSLTLPAAR